MYTTCVLLIIALTICATINEVKSSEADRPLVDHATLDYLSVESSLWTKLKNSVNTDEDYLFALIRNEHKRFLGKSKFFGGNDFKDKNIYKLPATENFTHILSEVELLRVQVSDLLQPDYATLADVIGTFEQTIITDAMKHSKDVIRKFARFDFRENGTNYLDYCRDEGWDTTIDAPYQKIFDYYRDTRVTHLQTYIFTQLSLMLQSVQDREPGEKIRQPTLSEKVKDEFKDNVKLCYQLASIHLKIASRDVWNCRPNKNYRYRCHDSRCTRFDALWNFLQGYIDNELNFNTEGTCAKSCKDYQYTKHHVCAENTLCAAAMNESERQRIICNGQIHDCSDIGIDGDFIVNYASNRASNLNRRYTYISSDEGSFGQKYGSSSGLALKAQQWRRWFVKCRQCYCTCDTLFDSHRYFSLHDVVSDIKQNKVVTGVRIKISNRVVQLQIEERSLKRRAQVNTLEGSSWISSKYQFTPVEHDPADGLDYFTMTYENRAINLGDVVAPAGKVVTGVRFSHRYGHILLEVRITDFDYATGQLKNIDDSSWILNEDSSKEIHIKNRSNPFERFNVDKLYVPINSKNSYIQFGPTDFNSDLGQTMIPLIDTDELGPSYPTALSGVGLTYENDVERSTGGVIAPKLIVYEFPVGDSIF